MFDVTIIATTWLPPGNERPRLDAFKKAIRSWSMNLANVPLYLHVADDGTDPYWFAVLKEEIEDCWYSFYTENTEITYSQQHRKGVGASLNAGLQQAFERSPIVFHAVDDWECLSYLDLKPWADMMEDNEYRPGVIRFFPHPDLTGTVKHVPPHGWAVELDRHHFLFGFRPALWHEGLFKAHGIFKENVSSFSTEYEFNERVCASYTNVLHRPALYGPRHYLALPEIWRPIETGSLAGVVPG